MALNVIWMRLSFLGNYLENKEGNINWTDGRNGHQKEIQGFPKWKERRHSTNNEYLLNTCYVPGTDLEPPLKEKKENANSEGGKGQLKAEGTEKPE